MPNISAAIKNAFAIPRRQALPVYSRDLPQLSQWSYEPSRIRRAEGDGVESDSPSQTCAATLSRADAEAVVDALPKAARDRLMEHARASASVRWRLAYRSQGAALIPGAIVFAVSLPLNMTAAGWIACCVFYFAQALFKRTIRRELLVQWFQTQPVDSLFDLCPNCGYDQRGSLSELCSECACPVWLCPDLPLADVVAS